MTEETKKTAGSWQLTFLAVVVAIFTLFIILNRGIPSSFVKEETGSKEKEFAVSGERETVAEEDLPEVIPTGVPATYGETLGISYDDVSASAPRKADATIEVMAKIDRTTELSGDDLDRYIDILHNQRGGISCEFCCGAKSVISEDGEAACGCAHSFAMRGITKHLILNTDMSDEDILSEVGKWKVLFFPGIHRQKAFAMEEEGMEVDYINLTTNENRGIEKGAAGGSMVGGC